MILLHDNERLLTSSGVAKILNLSDRAVMKRLHDGELPRPVYQNARFKQWRLSDILLWIESGCPGADHFEQIRAARLERLERQFFTEVRKATREALAGPITAAESAIGAHVDVVA